MSVSLHKSLERLQAFNDTSYPILSIYFNLPTKQVKAETIVNRLQTLINKSLTLKQRKEMQNNIRYIVGLIQKNYSNAAGETLGIFSGGDALFEVLHLPYQMKSSVHYAHRAYLDPISKAQEYSRRFLVILNDREKAIFYTIRSGKLEDRAEVFDNRVPKDVSGTGSMGLRTQRTDKIQRHVYEQLQKHFDYLAKCATDFIEDKPITGVILGGHKREMSQFEKHLPKSLQRKVIGNFVSELHTNVDEILKKSTQVITKVNKELHPQLLAA